MAEADPAKDHETKDVSEADPLALNNLMKSLRRSKTNSSNNNETGSSNGGNNSDNSALVSLGNTSFGFNFDSEEGMSNSNSANSDRADPSDDSDGQQNEKVPEVSTSTNSSEDGTGSSDDRSRQQPQPQRAKKGPKHLSTMSDTTNALSSSASNVGSDAHRAAASDAVANLQSIASSSLRKSIDSDSKPSPKPKTRKRKARPDVDAESTEGYNTDDERNDRTIDTKKAGSSSRFSGPSHGRSKQTSSSASGEGKGTGGRKNKKKKTLDDKKREERNAREKERSFRISKQIDDLRSLLSAGGIVVPKGTKSSVLVEAANYIRTLQQHQYRSELDRSQLVQQMQLIGSGAHGTEAATAIRHVAAQNGVWSLGQFGGVPPKSAMAFYQQPPTAPLPDAQSSQSATPDAAMQPSTVDTSDYRFVFNACGVGMAIASMGGAFIDCNQLFCKLSNYSKQEVCSLTIFNLTARQDLQQAFDLISQMISPPSEEPLKPIVLKGAMKNRDDLGLSVALVKGEDGIAKCFCVTLIRNPASPFDTSKPVPASFEDVLKQASATAINDASKPASDMNSSPAFTAG